MMNCDAPVVRTRAMLAVCWAPCRDLPPDLLAAPRRSPLYGGARTRLYRLQGICMTRKDRLHQLVDELPDDEVLAAQRYLEYLRDIGTDPVLRALVRAP